MIMPMGVTMAKVTMQPIIWQRLIPLDTISFPTWKGQIRSVDENVWRQLKESSLENLETLLHFVESRSFGFHFSNLLRYCANQFTNIESTDLCKLIQKITDDILNRDSNPGKQDGGRRRIHWTVPLPRLFLFHPIPFWTIFGGARGRRKFQNRRKKNFSN